MNNYNYSPKLTPKCCIDCEHYKNCKGCYDGIEFSNENIKKIINVVEEKVERGHTKKVSEIIEIFNKK